MSKAAAYRIVQTMERRAYLVREADPRPLLARSGAVRPRRGRCLSTNLVRAARPAMESLSAEFAETVNLGVLSSGAGGPTESQQRHGARVALVCGAAGPHGAMGVDRAVVEHEVVVR